MIHEEINEEKIFFYVQQITSQKSALLSLMYGMHCSKKSWSHCLKRELTRERNSAGKSIGESTRQGQSIGPRKEACLPNKLAPRAQERCIYFPE